MFEFLESVESSETEEIEASPFCKEARQLGFIEKQEDENWYVFYVLTSKGRMETNLWRVRNKAD